MKRRHTWQDFKEILFFEEKTFLTVFSPQLWQCLLPVRPSSGSETASQRSWPWSMTANGKEREGERERCDMEIQTKTRTRGEKRDKSVLSLYQWSSALFTNLIWFILFSFCLRFFSPSAWRERPYWLHRRIDEIAEIQFIMWWYEDQLPHDFLGSSLVSSQLIKKDPSYAEINSIEAEDLQNKSPRSPNATT